MRSILRFLIIIFVAICIGPPAGLASPDLKSGPDTLVYSWNSNVGPLNPHLYSPNQMFAQAMVYEPLVRYTAAGKIIPWLARRWENSADGREYIFYLRKDVRFSDGTPFNAAAVKKNHEALAANKDRHAWLELIAQIKRTEVLSPYVVKVIMKDPYYPILQDLALVRPVRYLSPSAFPKSEGITAPIGTGPWKLTQSKLGEYDIFERNDAYWGAKPSIKRIVVKVIPDPNTLAVAFETGDVDLIINVSTTASLI